MDDMDDHVDLSELEANLYAQIHHDAPETVEQYTAAQKLQQRTTGTISAVSHAVAGQPPPAAAASAHRIVTSSSVHNTGGGGAPPKRGRYWSDTRSGAGGGGNSPFAAAGPGGPGAANQAPNKKRANPFAAMPTCAPATDVTPVSLVSAQATANDYRPKPFTPYTSYLSQIGTSYVPLELPPSTSTTNHSAPSVPLPTSPNATATIQPDTTPTTTTIINPAATNASRKQRNNQRNKQQNNQQQPNNQQPQHQRRKGGQHTAGQLRQLDRARHAQEQYQRVGAVQKLAEGKLKKTQQLRAKQERADDARQTANAAFTSKSKVAAALGKPAHPFVTIDLDSDTADDDDDDDVICIPVPPPPLVCIESSEDEQEPASKDTSAESAATAADDDADSIAEDFVGRRDRNRLSLCADDSDAAMALGGIADSDLDMICATVEDAIRQHEQPASEAAPAVRSTETVPNMDTDNAVFATPKRARHAPGTALALDDSCSAVNQSYEVAENGFAAVDIYESESSDFPESVYEKGNRVATATDAADANGTAAANASDSDVSSIQLNTSNRAKRRCKRRSSTSNKGSDYKSSDNNEDDNVDDDDSDSDDDDADDSNDGPAFVDILRATNTPYLQRGEAVANAKTKVTRVPAVPPRRRRSLGKAGRSAAAATSTPTRGDAQSDDDFVSMLSCIVHDDKTGGEAGAGADADEAAELEAERTTIDARAIVENVLSKAAAKKESRRAKKAGGGQPAASVWMITDEVGQSDDAVAAVAEPARAKKSASSEKRSGVAGSVAGKSTAADFFVLDSVGETDPIPAPVVVAQDSTEMNTDTTVADAVVGATSSATAKATRTAPTANATAAPSAAAAGEGSDDDNASVQSCSLVVDNPELAWNDEMRSFYNKSWGGENYNQAEILRQMPKNRFEWTISEADLFPSSPQQTRRFNRRMKCHNCREEGHRAAECNQAAKPVRCHMCGGAGHREPRCPNTLCLRCGGATKVFSRGCTRCLPLSNVPCPLCKMRGHSSRDCPDKWRRYHSTTLPNTPLIKVPMLNTKPKYCCVCAAPGHLAEYCRNALRIMDGPLPMSKIQSYEESYQRTDAHRLRPDGRQLDSVAPYSLISAPLEHYKFVWCVNEAPDRLYGRMKAATQLQRPIFERLSKKRKKTRSESATTEAGRDKTPRTEITTPDGGRLVLNPASACRKRGAAKRVVEMETAESDCDETDDIMAVMESLDETPGEQQQQVVLDQSTDAAVDVSGNEDDAFAVTIDIDAVDEAVRQHMEQAAAATAAATKTVKSFQITVSNQQDSPEVKRSVVPTQLALNEPVTQLGTETPVTATALESFSFVSALDEMNRTKAAVDATNETSAIVAETVTPDTASPNASFSFGGVLPSVVDAAATDATSVDRPKTPPPPVFSAFAVAAEHKKHELQTEMRRLNKEEAYLHQLKGELTGAGIAGGAAVATAAGSAKKKANKQRRISERVEAESADDAAVGYHVVLNEEIEAVQVANGQHNDSDSNYSFSEYFNPPLEPAAESDAEPSALPDFIPIDSSMADDVDTESNDNEDDDILTPTQIDATAAAAADDDPSRYSEARIYLSKDHSKYLLTRGGAAFLSETYAKHGVKIRMEWSSIGNILFVIGRPTAQDSFHTELLAYCTKAAADVRKKQEISQQVPKNRQTLIRFIKEQIAQLERPLGNVRECFQRLLAAEQQKSKTGNRNADRARKTLNMMLLGQTGLRDGAMHLTALQSNLRCLVETETKELISTVFRNEVFQHFKYIFSSVSHDNYGEMVREYEVMRKAGRLPVLRLDRRLLGLRFVVGDAAPATPAPVADNVAVAESAPLPDVAGGPLVAPVVVEPVLVAVVVAPAAVPVPVPVEMPSPKKRIAAAAAAQSSAEVSEAAVERPAEPQTQTPKRPTNPYTKLLAVTASAKKNLAVAAANDGADEPLTEQAIVAELDAVAGDSDRADAAATAVSVADAAEPASDAKPVATTDGCRNADARASTLWSAKCQQYVDKCRAIPKIQSNENAMRRLAQVAAKARDGKLSYTDYRMLMKIFDKCV